ncbi:hypothetical protein C1I98_01545 [Spongiactinospora gelatinilytica]|uniref:Uncharacterized protein n=1 Tax=Spongiactinospora gelatinilytica TaxID=2666298 RepID=A0A2W2H6P5_9ACTN|nr:hypothetical protein [Spongiactinospora gelatinilytica]PZG56341.1 hypothetical protein C1I98_01545 [Spongiactinospora gelatinilytica]
MITEVNGLLATLTSRPSPTGHHLSSATVVRIHATLRTALNAAAFERHRPLVVPIEAVVPP